MYQVDKCDKCSVCGKNTVCILQNIETDEISHVFDKCKNCLIESSFTYSPIVEQITLSEDMLF